MEEQAAKLSTLRLYLVTSAMLGIQYAWAVQVGVTTAVLLELGMTARWVSLAWLAGPIAGLVVQPLVGLLSDRSSSRHGKRRPFVAVGAVLTSASLLAFAYAVPIARRARFLTPLFVAVSAFWCLDFSINAMQGPLRALIFDHVEAAEQERGNVAIAVYIAIGNLVGSAMAGAALTRDTFLRHVFSTDTEALYTIGAVLVLGTAAVCWVASAPLARNRSCPAQTTPWTVPESDNVRLPIPDTESMDEAESDNCRELASRSPGMMRATGLTLKPVASQLLSLVQHCRRALKTASTTFWVVFLIQLGTWYGWFSLFVFGSSWFGVNVFGGDPHALAGSIARERYEAGIRHANVALALQSIIAFLYAMLMPQIQYRVWRLSPMQVKYGFSLVVQATVLLALATIGARNVVLAVCLQAVLGISWATSITIPWALVGASVANSNARDAAGTFATLFNASQCFPEIAVALLSPVLGRHASVAVQHNRVLTSGAIMVGLSTLLVPFVHRS
jgi:solute carrier family 45 protein 1/2/4